MTVVSKAVPRNANSLLKNWALNSVVLQDRRHAAITECKREFLPVCCTLRDRAENSQKSALFSWLVTRDFSMYSRRDFGSRTTHPLWKPDAEPLNLVAKYCSHTISSTTGSSRLASLPSRSETKFVQRETPWRTCYHSKASASETIAYHLRRIPIKLPPLFLLPDHTKHWTNPLPIAQDWQSVEFLAIISPGEHLQDRSFIQTLHTAEPLLR